MSNKDILHSAVGIIALSFILSVGSNNLSFTYIFQDMLLGLICALIFLCAAYFGAKTGDTALFAGILSGVVHIICLYLFRPDEPLIANTEMVLYTFMATVFFGSLAALLVVFIQTSITALFLVPIK